MNMNFDLPCYLAHSMLFVNMPFYILLYLHGVFDSAVIVYEIEQSDIVVKR